MMAVPSAPVLVERALLLGRSETPDAQRIEELVVFQRQGHRVLLVAPRPRSWRPTRRNVDLDLALQQQFHQMFSRAGGELDGVLYVETGLFSRRDAQKSEFGGIARRYGRKTEELTLMCSDSTLIEAAQHAGVRRCVVGPAPDADTPACDSLKAALSTVK